MNANICDLCGRSAPILSAFWSPYGGPFDSPAGHACFSCRPDAFDDFSAAWLAEGSV